MDSPGLDELRERWDALKPSIAGRSRLNGELKNSLGDLLKDCIEAGRYTDGLGRRETLQWLAREIADYVFDLTKEYPLAGILPLESESEGQFEVRSDSLSKDQDRLSTMLERLYARRQRLASDSEDTSAVDEEILGIHRKMRKGPQLQAGDFLLEGRFKLIAKLGKGDFATVWKAYDRRQHRLVAVKVLHGQHSEDRSRRERFFRGARKMAELAHPNIVRVIEEQLQDEGWFFFVMEYVAGGDFNQAIQSGELGMSEKLSIITQVGSALEFAHKRGVIHRDVKPTNIVLDGDRLPKLTDFDLVLAADSTGLTQTQAMMGTLNYAAPEALESPKHAGPPADVYSLASTAIFAFLGGQLPRAYYRDPGPAIASIECPSVLAHALTRATAEDPEERFSSAGAFVSAVEEATGVMPPFNDVLIRAKGITKACSHGKEPSRLALNGLDLEIRRQSLVVIRGEDGYSKRILLRILGLADRDFEGHLEVFGKQIGGDSSQLSEAEIEDLRAHHYGFIFQKDRLLSLLTLRENCELPARMHHLPGPIIHKHLCQLQELIFKPDELAGGIMLRCRADVNVGQRQRTSILRALSHVPDLILADEPTANVEPAMKARILELFRQLSRAGATILITSRDPIFRDVSETYELTQGELKPVAATRDRGAGEPTRGAELGGYSALEHIALRRPTRLRGCPTGFQARIALREALGNPLFAVTVVAAMAAGLFQLTLFGSIRLGTENLLSYIGNEGLDRIVVEAKTRGAEATASGLPTVEDLASLGTNPRAVRRLSIELRVHDSRGRERVEEAFGLIPDDPEIKKHSFREGGPFEDQLALAVLITEPSVERFFGVSASGKAVSGRNIQIRFFRPAVSRDVREGRPVGAREELELDFVVQGVLKDADASANLYLPQGTLSAIAAWQINMGSVLKAQGRRLELGQGPWVQVPGWRQLDVYFDRPEDVLPSVAYFKQRGFIVQPELFRYKWLLDARRITRDVLLVTLATLAFFMNLLVTSNVVWRIRVHRKEFAVLKLMGMKNRNIVSIFVFIVLSCWLLGGVLGFSLGSLVVDSLRSYLFALYPKLPVAQILGPTWIGFGDVLLFCVVVAVGFTIGPAWLTARKEAVWRI